MVETLLNSSSQGRGLSPGFGAAWEPLCLGENSLKTGSSSTAECLGDRKGKQSCLERRGLLQENWTCTLTQPQTKQLLGILFNSSLSS
ncbi:hypothetical protein AV530_002530 [Patagioenas fasciata monilis]|uniref:Uncharacterized protein n=1 Tax=Patagioenas fasciata monilis TaxID=372326 RepID=A0A1V4K6V4_PATFA|nr:hypothetical protein AV530_002530 [Patagioenas fasciata monilis]